MATFNPEAITVLPIEKAVEVAFAASQIAVDNGTEYYRSGDYIFRVTPADWQCGHCQDISPEMAGIISGAREVNYAPAQPAPKPVQPTPHNKMPCTYKIVTEDACADSLDTAIAALAAVAMSTSPSDDETVAFVAEAIVRCVIKANIEFTFGKRLERLIVPSSYSVLLAAHIVGICEDEGIQVLFHTEGDV